MSLNKLLGALAVAMLLCSAFAKDQSSDTGTRTVEGVVTGTDAHPVTGAVVQLNDTRTLQIRSFITAEDGKYHFSGLSTNDNYELHAQFNGVSSGQRRLDVFNPRKLAKIDLKLKRK
jgi:carboxypeptidase family protein